MDPKKDLAVCGCSTVAWKDRMEEWKKRQNERRQVVKHEGHGGDDSDGLDLPKYIPLSPILEGYIILKEILDYCDDK
ncbi:cellulose synthase A catalytic subunit 5 [UDP-forming]-like isoform X2 [Rhododendron vialii]|uniref:cellulose synthase A catalytic subunit 5 [UDP-forming]-like isoform X2 n=1 Tax=Rhododendron vialii TaxID=182163 RepID=UPI00265F1B50|nr:cellulose synthase A catalytic subunit 5 [UDP-forming]-like isoform X2 [Rhododendron vialii]